MRFNPNEYVTVNERVEKFYAQFPQGRILTAVVENSFETGHILMRAEVYRNPDDQLPAATGHAFEIRGGSGANQTSHIENAETSAVGRALAMLGFEVKKSIASREEMQKVARHEQSGGNPEADPVYYCLCGDEAKYWRSQDGAKEGYFCAKPKGDPAKCEFKKWL